MPRPLRIELNDGWYHVMNRGGGRREIFKDDKQRLIFLDLLAEAATLFGIQIHAYCLMNNHYHLLIHTPRGNLSRAMRHINGLYTQKFNRLTKSDGALFRGRYKAILVDSDNYLLQVSRYIHLNPVTAKICRQPDKYRWSSCRYYYGKSNKPLCLSTKEIYSRFSGKDKVLKYREFVGEGLDSEIEIFYGKKNTSTILGRGQYKVSLLDNLTEERVKVSKADFKRTVDLPSMNDINSACLAYFKITELDLFSAKRGVENELRKIGMYACRVWASESLAKVSEQYGCLGHANVSKAVRGIESRMKTDVKLKRMVRGLELLIFGGGVGK